MAKKASKRKKTAKKGPTRKGAGRKAARRTAPRGAAKKASRKKAATGRKAATRKKAVAKTGGKAAGAKKAKRIGGPFPMRTGKGATPAEIGADLVASFNAGVPDEEIWKKWYSPRIESIEGSGQGWRGAAALRAKGAAFHKQYTVHSATAEGPYVGCTGFAVKYTIDMEDNNTHERHSGTEVGVYRVKNGRIVREEFMYG